MKKCCFMSFSVVFLGFAITDKGIAADPEKVKAIIGQPDPTNY